MNLYNGWLSIARPAVAAHYREVAVEAGLDHPLLTGDLYMHTCASSCAWCLERQKIQHCPVCSLDMTEAVARMTEAIAEMSCKQPVGCPRCGSVVYVCVAGNGASYIIGFIPSFGKVDNEEDTI